MVLFCQVLVLHPLFAQQVAGQRNLRIVVVQGEGARNVVQQIPPKPIVVRIEDAGGRPVGDATVVFQAPELGPSGEFENDSRLMKTTSAPDGTASAGVFHPNGITGGYQVRANAQFQTLTATALISQMNIGETHGHKKLLATVAIIGAAAGAALAFHGKSSSSSTTGNTPTITFGGSAVGAPK
jgi:hypothetical protein